MIVAHLVATLVPLTLLATVTRLARARIRFLWLVAGCLAWGMACTWPAGWINGRWAAAFGIVSLVTVGAPVIEETMKAAVLPFATATRRCSWFVDGAVLGMASGTGFVLRENWLYLAGASDSQTATGLALARVTSTGLMHVGCTGLVGAALAASIQRPWWQRILSGAGALVVAMSLHSAFNRCTYHQDSAAIVTLIGVAVFGVATGLVLLGGPLSRRWARDAMRSAGLSAGEQAVVGSRHDTDGLLDELETRFGSDVARHAEEFVAVQRRIGVASHRSPTDGGSGLSRELGELEAQANRLRRLIGVFPMTWLRANLPTDPTDVGLWASAAEATSRSPLDTAAPTGAPGGLWSTLTDD